MIRTLHVAAFLAVAPLAVAAEGWTSEDLGTTASEAECLSRAVDMFEVFGDRFSFHSVGMGSWTVAGYDLTDNDYDGLVTCAFGPDDTTSAVLLVYSVGSADSERRGQIASTLKEIWNE